MLLQNAPPLRRIGVRSDMGRRVTIPVEIPEGVGQSLAPRIRRPG